MTMSVQRVGVIAGGLMGLLGAITMAQAADDHPPYLPSKDVSVVYSLERKMPGGPTEAHMYYQAATSRMRLDAPGQQGYVIIDRAKGRMMIVMTNQHLFMETPLNVDMASGFLLNDQMKFQRLGPETVAGQSCTDWQVQSSRANGLVCITEDGVLLKGHGQDKDGGAGALVATAVSYQPQPADLFAPPAGYNRVPMPQGVMPGQGGGQGGAAPQAK